ncbi:hypothetical protein IW262DRAFT_1498189 [Armillaria fumosa]|nr:hypothetical protein IW262DRAFT_1498189 [Armillaria fumosa]
MSELALVLLYHLCATHDIHDVWNVETPLLSLVIRWDNPVRHDLTHSLFVKKVDLGVPPPPPPPRKVVPLTEQQFIKREECPDLNDSDNDDSLFYKSSPSRESNSIQVVTNRSRLTFKDLGRW